MVTVRGIGLLGLILIQAFGVTQASFRFASTFGNHMVLQSWPLKSVVWGYAPAAGKQVNVTMGRNHYTTTTAKDPLSGSIVWGVMMKAQAPGGPHTINATYEKLKISLRDVLFGDVWICSGQSNMEHTVRHIDNAADELARAANFTKIRIFRVGKTIKTTPQRDIINAQQAWTRPLPSNVKHYSGVCWGYGRRLFQKLRKPIGLIQAAWGGTRIETWSSPDPLKKCGHVRGGSHANQKSVLWNAMIHPLLNTTIKGAIWYQGESNNRFASQYKCQFPAMIADWRAKFSQSSGTHSNFPFGFVQIAPGWHDPNVKSGFPDLRWAQTAGMGYAPNSVLKNVFMAVAMDLPDFDSPVGAVHPRYKQDIARRLSISGLTLAYGQNMGRWWGPRPTNYYYDRERREVNIVYDYGNGNIYFKNGEGYELCCSPRGRWTCMEGDSWRAVPARRVEGTSRVSLDARVCSDEEFAAGVRYAWQLSPCNLRQCSVYTTPIDNELPAPPFIHYKNFV